MGKFKVLLSALLVATFFSSVAVAQDEDVSALKAQVQALQERVNELESAKQQKSQSIFNYNADFQWDPFKEMEHMQQVMDQMFQNSVSRRGVSPFGMLSNNLNFDQGFDIQQKDNSYVIKIDIEGFNQDKIEVDIHNDSITISGEQSKEEKQQDPNGMIQSSSYGSFIKSFPIPADADTNKAQTEKKDNELIITIPKK